MKAKFLVIPAAILIVTASFNSSTPFKPEREIVKPRTTDAGFAFFRTHRHNADQNVFPAYINDRIVALPMGDNSTTSEVSTVRIVSHK